MQIKFIDQGVEVFVLRSWVEVVLAWLVVLNLHSLIGLIVLAALGRTIPPSDFVVDAFFVGAYALAFALVRKRNSRRAAAGASPVDALRQH